MELYETFRTFGRDLERPLANFRGLKTSYIRKSEGPNINFSSKTATMGRIVPFIAKFTTMYT